MARTEPRTASNNMKCPVTVEDVDLFSPGAQEHWYEAYPLLHEAAPVRRLPGEGTTPAHDGFILSKFEDIWRVVHDPDRFAPFISEPVPRKPDGSLPPMNAMIEAIQTLRPNDDLWRAHRQQLTDPWVGPGAVRHRTMITRYVDELIDAWIDRGRVDFVNEFARPLPQLVMATILGFPLEDVPRLEIWGGAQVMAFVHGTTHRNLLTEEQTARQNEILAGFKDYVQYQVEDKRRHPKDDMITFLTQTEYEALGRKLTDVEINGVVYAMVIGGLETTQYALAEQMQLFCEDAGLYRQIRDDRRKLRFFIEEALRLRAPTQGLSTRFTRYDEVFQGVPVPAGSILHLRWAAANRDPAVFESPNDIKLDREAITRHLTFSQGPRSCPGSGLSRTEQTAAWGRLLDRIETVSYGAGNKFEHQPGIMLGLNELHIEFRKA